MAIADHIVRWGGTKVSKRVARDLPWVGAAIALATVAATMKRKGVFRGGLDTALNAMPVVGAMKNVVEMMRGRDFIADRPVRAVSSQPR